MEQRGPVRLFAVLPRFLLPALLVSLLLPPHLSAQYDRVPPPTAYALPVVTVVGEDGVPAEGVTVVIRDGIIQRIEAGAPIPADAELLEGEDLVVYPGLVDAWGAANLDLPAPPPASEATPWDPSRAAHGFTPHRRAVDHLTDVGEDFRPRRAEGVVASGVFPTGGFAAGLGAVLLHRPDARDPRELVAVPEAGLAMSFSAAATSYPSTLFGVMAYIRQAFSDAQRLAVVEREYRRSPNGLTHPEWDPDAEVLRRAAGAGLPVYFAADDVEEIRRVLGLAYEVGFSPVIVGGGEAWRLSGELAALRIPVLVSLDFPEAEEWDPDGQRDVPPEQLAPAEARERERLVDRYSNAARLEEAGVTFALTSGGGDAEVRDAVRRALEYGLSEDAALRALTSTPAELLGIGAVGRLTPGFAANFVVTDGPLFDEETRVVYTFVDGVLDRVGPEAGEEASGGGAP